MNRAQTIARSATTVAAAGGGDDRVEAPPQPLRGGIGLAQLLQAAGSIQDAHDTVGLSAQLAVQTAPARLLRAQVQTAGLQLCETLVDAVQELQERFNVVPPQLDD